MHPIRMVVVETQANSWVAHQAISKPPKSWSQHVGHGTHLQAIHVLPEVSLPQIALTAVSNAQILRTQHGVFLYVSM